MIHWFRERERWGVVLVGLETGNVYDMPFARFSSPERAQGFIDNLAEYTTPLTEYRIVDRHSARHSRE